MSVTLTISQNDYEVPDTYIISDSPTTNTGKQTTFYVGYLGAIPTSHTYRTLLKFPLTDLPSTARILTAKITLYCTTAAASAEAASWNAMTTRNWTETQATWNVYQTGLSWTTAGGDYNMFEGGTFNLPTATGDFDITDITGGQIWAAYGESDNSFNVILRRSTEGAPNAYMVCASGEHATTAWRPRLIITYMPANRIQGDVRLQGDVTIA